MKLRYVIFIILPLTIIVTAISYKPVSILYFKIAEPTFICPVNTPQGFVIRNDSMGEGHYGAKRRNGRLHTGIDIIAPVGAPVYASKSGIAFFANVPTGYGKYVSIYHPDGFQSMYAHLSEWNGKGPRNVRKGELIGFVGKSGNASSKAIEPHLHFEIRRDGRSQDPTGMIKP